MPSRTPYPPHTNAPDKGRSQPPLPASFSFDSISRRSQAGSYKASRPLFYRRQRNGIQCSDYAIRIGIKQAFRLIDQTDFLRFILASYHKESQGS